MKLSPFTVIVCAFSFFIVLMSYGYFYYYAPNMAEAKMYDDYRAALQLEADKLPNAKKRRDQAVALVVQAQAQWKAVVDTRTPPTSVRDGGIDLSVNSLQLVPDAKEYRNSLQIAVNAQVKKGGVKLPNGGPTVPDPGNSQPEILANFFNYPATAFPVVVLDLGQITVQGTYSQIMANYKAWGQMPRYMALVDGLRITGTSPLLQGTYNVQVLGFIRAKDIFPPAPEAALASNQGGGGGGGGGPFGGAGGRGPGGPAIRGAGSGVPRGLDSGSGGPNSGG